MARSFIPGLSILLGIPLLAGTAIGQTVPASNSRSVEVSRLFQNDPSMRADHAETVEETQDDLFAPVSPGDEDIGVQQMLQERERIKHWLVFGEVGGYYT